MTFAPSISFQIAKFVPVCVMPTDAVFLKNLSYCHLSLFAENQSLSCQCQFESRIHRSTISTRKVYTKVYTSKSRINESTNLRIYESPNQRAFTSTHPSSQYVFERISVSIRRSPGEYSQIDGHSGCRHCSIVKGNGVYIRSTFRIALSSTKLK